MVPEYSFDRLVEVAERWKKTRPERVKAKKARTTRDFAHIDSTERIVKFTNRFQEQVKCAVVGRDAHGIQVPKAAREFADVGPVTSADINSAFVERVIGHSKEFLSAVFFELGLRAMSSVARIDLRAGDAAGFATGFMVSPSLMLTNWHVFEEPGWAHESRAQFDYQRDRLGREMDTQEFGFDRDLFINDERLDFALVAVKPDNLKGSKNLAGFGYLPLVGQEGKILVTDPVNIIQHPKGRLKEVVIRENELSALPDGELDGFAHYLADTEQGSSGSPVFSDGWEVIALHHSAVPAQDKAGNFLRKDRTGIWDRSMPLEDLLWAGNEGIRISRIVKHLEEARPAMSPKMGSLVDELLRKSNTVELGPSIGEPNSESNGPGTGSAASADASSGQLAASGPVTININIITGGSSEVQTSRASFTEALKPKDFELHPRRGFDRNFLGFELSMPTLADAARGPLATLHDGTHELRYFHFSVLMNEARRLAYVSAVNYDHAAPWKQDRDDPGWFIDTRLDVKLQADNRHYSDYSGKENPLDRGHLTRRADAAWGYTEQEAIDAGVDSYHWCNVAPQHKVFNQSGLSKPKDLRLWGELENHVTNQAKAGIPKLSIFNGPVFANPDREYRGLRIPTAFWKIIAYRKRDDTLGVVGFVLEQSDLIDRLTERFTEDFDPGPFDLRQVKISRIEEITGLNFGALRSSDPLARESSVFETGASDRRLHSAADIRF